MAGAPKDKPVGPVIANPVLVSKAGAAIAKVDKIPRLSHYMANGGKKDVSVGVSATLDSKPEGASWLVLSHEVDPVVIRQSD